MNKNIKILLVIDTMDSANDKIAAELQSLKLQNIVAVNNSKSALKEFVKERDAHPFDVTLITDLASKDQIELLKSLIEIDPDHYVVMLTGEITPDKILTSIKNGASGILSKPYSAAKLGMELEKYALLREDRRAINS